MQVIKRDGSIVEFNEQKISDAITKAYKEVDRPLDSIGSIMDQVLYEITSLTSKMDYSPYGKIFVEKIQDIVEKVLMDYDKDVAKAYILYRQKRQLARENTTDKTLEEYLSGTSEY